MVRQLTERELQDLIARYIEPYPGTGAGLS